jgi:CubicO group peptidase (beta-lactamase class C family)
MTDRQSFSIVGLTSFGIDQPVAEMLPSGARMPCRRGEPIKLAHLEEHTSTLPRLPGNLWAAMGLYRCGAGRGIQARPVRGVEEGRPLLRLDNSDE